MPKRPRAAASGGTLPAACRRFIVAAIVGAALSPALTDIAFAQAGNTGGSLGVTDKSASGSEGGASPRKVEPHRPPPAKKAVSRNPPKQEAAAPVAPAGPKTFVNPSVNGMRVDHCPHAILTPGCDQGAATYWCESQGMKRAVNFTWEVASPTFRQEEGSVCTFLCGGFTRIDCE